MRGWMRGWRAAKTSYLRASTKLPPVHFHGYPSGLAYDAHMNRVIHSKAVVWTLTILPAIGRFQAGAGKLIHRAVWAQNFDRWGYPGWFGLVVGALEVISGVALLVPRAAAAAAIVLAVVMVWALASFLHAGETSRMLGPVLVFPFLCIVAYLRRPGMVPMLSALGRHTGA
jgi:uncharacterized membrane protein YphA (DoxX/SURF4 family)